MFLHWLGYFVQCVLYSGRLNLIMAVIHFYIVINTEQSAYQPLRALALHSSVQYYRTQTAPTFFRCLLEFFFKRIVTRMKSKVVGSHPGGMYEPSEGLFVSSYPASGSRKWKFSFHFRARYEVSPCMSWERELAERTPRHLEKNS